MENERDKWKEQRLKELANLKIDDDFNIPIGFYIPFGDGIILKEIVQGEIKTKSNIILGAATTRTIGASLGQIYSIGELVTLPIFEGMKVYYEPQTALRVYVNGIEYVQIAQHNIFGAVPPETHLQPYIASFIDKRREKRLAGAKAVEKRDNEDFGKKLDLKASEGKTQFAVTNFKKP